MTPDARPKDPGRTNGDGPLLLERDRELLALRAAVENSVEGHAAIAVVEGPAGIGKTRLIYRGSRDAAAGRDMRVLSARGVRARARVPVRRRAPALRARPGRSARSPSAARRRGRRGRAAGLRRARRPGRRGRGRRLFAALHGLFWLTANASRRAAALLASTTCTGATRRRCASSPTSPGASRACRCWSPRPCAPAEPGTDAGLLAEVVAGPVDRRHPPRPADAGRGASGLVADAVRRRRRPALRAAVPPGDRRQPAAARPAAEHAQGRRASQPDAASVTVVREIGPRAVSRTILHAARPAARGRGRGRARRRRARRERRTSRPSRRSRACPRRRSPTPRASSSQAEIIRPEPPLGVRPSARPRRRLQRPSAGRARAPARPRRGAAAPGRRLPGPGRHPPAVDPAGAARPGWPTLLQDAARSAIRKGAPGQRRDLPQARARGAAAARAARLHALRAGDRRDAHERARLARAPERGTRGDQGPDPARHRGRAAGADADVLRAPRGGGRALPRVLRRAGPRARRSAQGVQDGRADRPRLRRAGPLDDDRPDGRVPQEAGDRR